MRANMYGIRQECLWVEFDALVGISQAFSVTCRAVILQFQVAELVDEQVFCREVPSAWCWDGW